MLFCDVSNLSVDGEQENILLLSMASISENMSIYNIMYSKIAKLSRITNTCQKRNVIFVAK